MPGFLGSLPIAKAYLGASALSSLRLGANNVLPAPVASWSASSGSLPAWLTAAGGANRTRRNASGLIVSASAPRFDYSNGPNAELLVEAAATNLMLQSNVASVTGWTATRSTITTGVAPGSDGGATSAARLRADATAANSHLMQQTISFTSGVTYTLSALVERDPAGAGSWVQIRLPSAAFGNIARASFDVSKGVVGTTLFCTASIRPADIAGFYLCSITAAATTTTSGAAQAYVMQANDTINFDGDSLSALFVFGFQLEANDYASSRIPTTTVAVAATADVISAAAPYTTNPARVYVRNVKTGVLSVLALAQLSDINTLSGYSIIRVDVY